MQQLAVTVWARSKTPAPARAYIPRDSATRATARTYVENARLIEALAAQYGFTAVYVWQPSLHASQKVLDPFEQRLRRNIERDPFHGRLQQVHRDIPPLLDSAMARVAPGRFVDAAQLFRGDTMPVYTDWLGHNTEESVPRIVDAFWPALQTATQAAIARRRSVAVAAPAGAIAHRD
jgi:hypothetical protein